MPDRILVDLLSYTGTRGGTETYVREIAPRLPDALPGVELIALANRVGADRVRAFFPGRVRTLRTVGADRVSWALGAVFATTRAARSAGADLVWCPANFGPIRRGPSRRVVTVHDAIYHEAHGSPITRAMSAITSWLMTRSARTADAVVTVSHAAAHAIGTHMGVPASLITVVPNGANPGSAPADPWAAVAPLGVHRGRPILLSTGNRLPHKNFAGLLRALASVAAEDRPLAVITGGGSADPLTGLRSELGLDADVVLPGWVGAEQLEALYAVADLYVCPSLAEGFGLPVVDALRREVPVLANDIEVLREVGGDAVRYADATDAAGFGRALRSALSDPPAEAARTTAREWAERFTWERAAAATAGVLRDALHGDRPEAGA